MAATVTIRQYTGASPGTQSSSRTTIRMSTSDNTYTTETTNPIPIPGAGTNYSFWVSTKLNADTTPTGTINNLRWYSDGTTFGTGLTCNGRDASTGADGGYRVAAGTTGTTGTQLTTGNHTGLDGTPADVTTYTSGSPASLGGTISNPTTGTFGDFFVYQLAVGTTASAGTVSARTFTWKYDET